MKKNHWIGSFFSIVILLLSLLPLCVSAENAAHADHAQGIAVRSEEELSQMQAGAFYYLDADVTLSETVEIKGEIHLCLNGKILKYENEASKGSVFRIGKEGVLRIFDCSQESHGLIADSHGLWTLTDDADAQGRRELKGGVIIGGTGEKRESEELKNTYSCGGFAYVDGGSLFLYGGHIAGNHADYGGAVYVTGEGHFEMRGGSLRGNAADFRGGAVFIHSGTMLLNDGAVSDNRAAGNGGGIDVSAAGILEMRGGSVTGNTAGAWSGGIENFGAFELYGGTIGGNHAAEDAGGVYNGGVFTMYGGTIRENTAKYGGGICNDGKMTLHGGKILSNLAQESGGGIYNADKLVINGGSIASNTAVTSGGGIENDGFCEMYGGVIGGVSSEDANMAHLGGGVCIYSGSFTMYGGSIERNTGVDGGGVENEALLTVQGGKIAYNYASAQGGGVTNRGRLILGGGASVVSNASGTDADEPKGGGIYWIAEGESTVSVTGAVTVIGNTTNGISANLVVCGKGTVSASALSEASKIGISLLNGDRKPVSGETVRFVDLKEGETERMRALFTSDHGDFEIELKDGALRLTEKNTDFLIGACIVAGASVVITAAVLAFSAIRKRKVR
ncbi:MAG: hypothetical protein IJD59_01670 [Clostridia bacterium]|nr:hypothetical protein [Clostridia bacterium]